MRKVITKPIIFYMLAIILTILFTACGKTKPANTESKKVDSITEITIDPSMYNANESKWSEIMRYEANPKVESGGKFTHAFGSKTGKFVYKFNVPTYNSANVGKITISAQLSSEFNMYSGPADGFSDVCLLVNNNEYESQRVIPDDGHGKIYTWQVDKAHLNQGENTVSFEIKPDSKYKNGLCIYYVSKVQNEKDEPIRVKIYKNNSVSAKINNPYDKNPDIKNTVKLKTGLYGDLTDIINCINGTITKIDNNEMHKQVKIYSYEQKKNYYLDYDLRGKKEWNTVDVKILYDSPDGKTVGETYGILHNGTIIANVKDIVKLFGSQNTIQINEVDDNNIIVNIIDGDFDGIIDGHYKASDSTAKDIDLDPYTPYRHPVILIHGRTDNSLELYGLGNSLSEKDKSDKYINSEYGLSDKGSTSVFDRSKYVTFEKQKIKESMTVKSIDSKTQLGDKLISDAHYKPNINLFVFNYPNEDMIKLNASLFAEYMNNLINEGRKQEVIKKGLFKTQDDCDFGYLKFDLIGHSMGGLVARYYIENGQGENHVNKLITLDTPHFGGNIAVGISKNTGAFFTPNILDLNLDSQTFGGIDDCKWLLRTGPDVEYGKSNLTDTLKNSHSSKVSYYAIGSAFSVASSDKVQVFDQGLIMNNFCSSTSLLITDGDGVVNIDSQLGLYLIPPTVRVSMNKVAIYYTNDIMPKGYPSLHQWMTHDSMVCNQVIEFLKEKN